MLHSHLNSPGIFRQRPLTQISEKVHSSMSVGETERERKEEKKGEKRERDRGEGRERPSCEGLEDHGIMVESWQRARGSEGRSPLLKNDSFGTKKNAQTYLEGYLLAVRAAAKVMKFCSSTSLDTAQVITVCCCLSGDLQQWTGCFRVFDTRAE